MAQTTRTIAFVKPTAQSSKPPSVKAALVSAELVLPAPHLWISQWDAEAHLRWLMAGGAVAARGLVNQGNTCFLNATLQCLAATPAFVQYLRTREHSRVCSSSKDVFCVFCSVEQLVGHVMHRSDVSGPCNPRQLTLSIKALGRQFRPGRQEDSHEFLRCLLERMHAAALRDAGVKEGAPGRLDETTSLCRIFGGYFRNQVHCPRCFFDSNSYEPFMDLSLMVGGGIDTVDKALRHFAAPEELDAANKWMCPRCAQPVRAVKQLTVRSLPPVLTVHLKRFSYKPPAPPAPANQVLRGKALFHSLLLAQMAALRGPRKITGHIAFPLVLDMGPALSDAALKEGIPRTYELTGALVHEGSTPHSGHYYAFVKGPCGNWALQNDESTQRVREAHVLSASAYMLFYSRRAGGGGGGGRVSGGGVVGGAVSAAAAAPPLPAKPDRVEDLESLQWSRATGWGAGSVGGAAAAAAASAAPPAKTFAAAVAFPPLPDAAYGIVSGAGAASAPTTAAGADGGEELQRLGGRKRRREVGGGGGGVGSGMGGGSGCVVTSGAPHRPSRRGLWGVLRNPLRLPGVIGVAKVGRLRMLVKKQHLIFSEEGEGEGGSVGGMSSSAPALAPALAPAAAASFSAAPAPLATTAAASQQRISVAPPLPPFPLLNMPPSSDLSPPSLVALIPGGPRFVMPSFAAASSSSATAASAAAARRPLTERQPERVELTGRHRGGSKGSGGGACAGGGGVMGLSAWQPVPWEEEEDGRAVLPPPQRHQHGGGGGGASSRDEWDSLLDAGRVKKVKMTSSSSGGHGART